MNIVQHKDVNNINFLLFSGSLPIIVSHSAFRCVSI